MYSEDLTPSTSVFNWLLHLGHTHTVMMGLGLHMQVKICWKVYQISLFFCAVPLKCNATYCMIHPESLLLTSVGECSAIVFGSSVGWVDRRTGCGDFATWKCTDSKLYSEERPLPACRSSSYLWALMSHWFLMGFHNLFHLRSPENTQYSLTPIPHKRPFCRSE